MNYKLINNVWCIYILFVLFVWAPGLSIFYTLTGYKITDLPLFTFIYIIAWPSLIASNVCFYLLYFKKDKGDDNDNV